MATIIMLAPARRASCAVVLVSHCLYGGTRGHTMMEICGIDACTSWWWWWWWCWTDYAGIRQLLAVRRSEHLLLDYVGDTAGLPIHSL